MGLLVPAIITLLKSCGGHSDQGVVFMPSVGILVKFVKIKLQKPIRDLEDQKTLCVEPNGARLRLKISGQAILRRKHPSQSFGVTV